MQLRVSTDCSGIDTPITVLGRLGVDHRQLHASDADASCRRYIESMHSPEVLYSSVYDRPLRSSEQVDLYVAGPPCTAASSLNTTQSESGRDAAYAVGTRCFLFIQASRPYAFVIENVPKLKTVRGGAVLRDWLALVDDGYDVEYRTLNARHHGSPQNRDRLYIVGVRRDNPHGWAVRFPDREPLPFYASDVLDPDAVAPGLTGPQAAVLGPVLPVGTDHVISIQSSRMHARLNGRFYGDEEVSACIVSGMPYYYSIRYKRRLTACEMARLQGFRDEEVDLTCRGLPRMLGNAMNAQVLQRLLECVMGLPRLPPPRPRCERSPSDVM